MEQSLSIAFRPQALSEMVGAAKLVAVIKGHVASGRLPQAWLFAGDTGSGKTTVARILARALQCTHVSQFGLPCPECASNQFDILEVNASEISGVENIGKIAEGSLYGPRPPSKYRVYILDEAQRLSTESQNLLLKYFEDCPKTSVWIICTTNPQKILKPLRSRCVYYELSGLKPDGVKLLVQRAIRFAKGTKPAEPLVDALLEVGVWSPRFILMGVEKYLAGSSPAQAASVDSVEITVDTLKLCRGVAQGKWAEVRVVLKALPPDESRSVAQAVMGYLTTVILTATSPKQADMAGVGIQKLSKVGYLDDGMKRSVLTAILYDITAMFGGKKTQATEEPDED